MSLPEVLIVDDDRMLRVMVRDALEGRALRGDRGGVG